MSLRQWTSAHGFSFTSAEEIWEEIRTVWPAGAGITYRRLEDSRNSMALSYGGPFRHGHPA